MTPICTVLVVEDDPHISDLIVFLLEAAGYKTEAANTAARARRLIEEHDLDLVILDWMLPDTPGDKLCHEIKSRQHTSFLPILMLTARSALADRIAGLDAGADDFLSKPFHADELMARVRALLRIRLAEVERLQMIDKLRQAYDQLAATQAQLVQTSRLAALGELVAGVAHELNNPLGIILGNAELLPTLADPEDRRAVTQIIAGAQRARRIVQSLVTFARQGKMEENWYKPSDLIERVLDLKRADLRNRGIALSVEYEPHLPMLWADGAQIQQVLLHLVLNAEYALHDCPDSQIHIRVFQRHAPVGPPPLATDQRDDDVGGDEPVVVIDVADNGTGINDEVRGKLFQPFVTTKPVGEAAGLGLAISYGIVTQHGGTLQLNSQLGFGSCFRVTLPTTRSGVPAAPKEPNNTMIAETGLILVVDEEVAILDFVNRLLSRKGWQVETTQRAQRALDIAQTRLFDVVLCDAKMPDMDGSTFYQHLQHAHGPQMPQVIMMTNDTSSDQAAKFLHNHHLPVLRKPFTTQELLRALSVPPRTVENDD